MNNISHVRHLLTTWIMTLSCSIHIYAAFLTVGFTHHHHNNRHNYYRNHISIFKHNSYSNVSSCSEYNYYRRKSISMRSLKLNLFNMPNIEGGNAVWTDDTNDTDCFFPNNMAFLTSPTVYLPAKVDMTTSTYSNTGPSNIVVRFLEERDLDNAVDFILAEYGVKAGKSKLQKDAPMIPIKWLDDALTSYEDFGFGSLVKFGLWQRILRRKEGERPGMTSDHNVIICESTNREMLGMAEVSIQPNIPTRTATPVPILDSIKRGIAEKNSCQLFPYVSNVLVKSDCRGFGIGKILMAACEGRAKAMGYDSVYLHVDANISTGSAAQRLYSNLGYTSIEDINSNISSDDMQLKNGVYLVDNLPLLYLSKTV